MLARSCNDCERSTHRGPDGTLARPFERRDDGGGRKMERSFERERERNTNEYRVRYDTRERVKIRTKNEQ